jgi:elongation factor P hydroxylase
MYLIFQNIKTILAVIATHTSFNLEVPVYITINNQNMEQLTLYSSPLFQAAVHTVCHWTVPPGTKVIIWFGKSSTKEIFRPFLSSVVGDIG